MSTDFLPLVVDRLKAVCHHLSPVTETDQNFGLREWLQRHIQGLEMSQKQWAEKSGIPFDTVRAWMRKNPPRPLGVNLVRLAKATGKTRDEIESMSDRDRQAGTVPIRNRPGVTIQFHRVPLFNSVSAARWSDRSNMDYPEGSADQFVASPTPDPQAFGAVVDGDCMEPDYPDGWVALFSPGEMEDMGFVLGREYFVQLDGVGDGENTFKRLVRVDSEELIFRCINAAYPDEIRVRKDQIIRAALAVDCIRHGGRQRQS